MREAIFVAVTASVLTTAVDAQSPRPASAATLRFFETTHAVVQDLDLPKTSVATFSVQVLLDGRPHTLELHAHDVRTKDHQVLAIDAAGVVVVPRAPNTTYRGRVHGHRDSLVAASLLDGQLTAMFQLDRSQPMWNIQPLRQAVGSASRRSHVIHNDRNTTTPRHECGVRAVAATRSTSRPTPTNVGPIQVCEIACDADYEKYLWHNRSTTAAAADVAAIINACSAIYARDVEVEFQITRTIVRRSPRYPNNQHQQLLNDFGNQWVRNHAGIRRDVAHLFTGKSRTSNVIGVASAFSICSPSSGYGLSFTHFSRNLTSRVGLTAHEIGHNFGSLHCSGSDCYIMCSGLGGCGRNLTRFGPFARNAIAAHRDTRNCLHKRDGPHVDTVSPTSVQAFDGGRITLTGSNFTNAIRLRVGTRALTPGPASRKTFTIVSDTQITFESPTARSLDPAEVKVESSIGHGRPQTLGYTVTRPRKLEATPTAIRGQEMIWEWGAGPNHNWFLTVSVTPTTQTLFGLEWLVRPTLLLSGTNDAAGAGKVRVMVPGNALVGIRFWSQVVTVNPFQLKFGGNTNTPTTVLQ